MQNVQPGKSPIALRPGAAVGLLPSVGSLVSLEVGTLCVYLEKSALDKTQIWFCKQINSNWDFSQCFNFGIRPTLSQPGCSHLCVLLCRLQVGEEEETKEGMEELHTELGRCAGRGREVRPGKRAAAVSIHQERGKLVCVL